MSQEAYVPKDGDYGELSFKPIVGKVSVGQWGGLTIDPEDGRDKWSFDVLGFADPRSDWVFTPKTPPAPPLPTAPGSVVRGNETWVLRPDGRWQSPTANVKRKRTPEEIVRYAYGDPIHVIFDAGAEA